MTEDRPRIRVYIADDEKPARRTVRALLQEDEELEVVGEGYGREALRDVSERRPDLLLLDVRMPGMDGFQILRELPEEAVPDVVFITAYDEYAVEAFEVRALDYLLKPFTDQRFHDAIRRAKERIRQGESRGAAAASLVLSEDEPRSVKLRGRRLVLEEGGRTLLIPLEEIDWIEASGTYSTLHGQKGSYVVRITMSELEQRLDGRGFCRIHRSSIVRLGAIREIHSLSHGDALVMLETGTKLRLTRSRRDELERALER
jgi:two-component system LytT family response regulator